MRTRNLEPDNGCEHGVWQDEWWCRYLGEVFNLLGFEPRVGMELGWTRLLAQNLSQLEELIAFALKHSMSRRGSECII
jgi:hypothetical protein